MSRELTIRYGFGTTPVGPALAAWTERGICFLRLMAHDRHKTVRELQERYPDADWVPDEAAARDIFQRVAAYLDGEKKAEPALDLKGTAFQQKVWQALRRIPHGQTQSYQEVARRIGRPRAVRAVGNACGANPVGILVPCHRVVASDGGLGGYGWGLECKQTLLNCERTG